MKRNILPCNKTYSFLLALLFLGISVGAYAQSFELYYTTESRVGLEPHEIINSDFTKSESTALNFQNETGSIWVKIKLQEVGEDFLLTLDNSMIDSVDFYQIENDKIVSEYHTGDNYLYEQRIVNHPKFIFPLAKSEGASEILVRIRSQDLLFVPVIVEGSDQTVERLNTYNLIKGMYYGIVLVMFFYNFLIAVVTRDSNYYAYSGYVIFFGLAQMAIDGSAFQYFFPNSPEIYNHSIIAFPSIAGILAIIFTIDFLKIKVNAPRWLAGMYAFMLAYFLALVLDLAGYKAISINILNTCGITIGIYALMVAGKLARNRYRPAYFFILAWSLFIVSLLVFVFSMLGVIPFNVLTSNALNIGNAVQIVLLSIALADRINVLRKEKLKSQAEALKVSRENEQIIREQNLTLEQKVNERTFELQEANEELTVTLSNLRDAQTQLVDAEKMASLGQLTAGIAHEINNPINFVTSNIKPLRRDLEEIYELIEAYSGVTSEEISKLEQAHELREELDYDYLKSEIESLVDGISDGALRTAEIVRGLRTFSRLDEDAIKKADIHEGLASTLVLLRSKTQDAIEIVQDYDPNLPLLDCFPGKLNQVFMNILNNAIYAVTNKTYEAPEKAVIIMKTVLDDNNIHIHIKDNGIGMDEGTKKKMFDPFFTTKDVGEGTGLGMAIVYKIIEKHRGSLQVESELNKGTEFIITLPLRQPNEFE